LMIIDGEYAHAPETIVTIEAIMATYNFKWPKN
jgi:hypothetical protein